MNKRKYHNALWVFIGLIVLFAGAVVAFNYYFDGSKQFYQRKLFQATLTDELLHNNSVMVCSNYNDRSLQKTMLRHLANRPPILILGSSRTMPIHQGLFKKSSVYNASVFSASLEDDVALFNVYQKKWHKPDVVIISLDPWILGINKGKTQWRMSLFKEYQQGHPLERMQGLTAKYSQLLSYNYFKDSVKNAPLIRRALKLNMPSEGIVIQPTNLDRNTYPTCANINPDGSRYFSQVEENAEAMQVDSLSAVRVQDAKTDTLNTDHRHKQLFETFIHDLQQQNIKVVFYLPPYAPRAYDVIQSDPQYNAIRANEKYFLSIANQNHIEVIGSYNPSQLALSSGDFIDYLHLKKTGVNKVFHQSKLNF